MYVVSFEMARPSIVFIAFLSLVVMMTEMIGPSVDVTLPPVRVYLSTPCGDSTNVRLVRSNEEAFTVSLNVSSSSFVLMFRSKDVNLGLVVSGVNIPTRRDWLRVLSGRASNRALGAGIGKASFPNRSLITLASSDRYVFSLRVARSVSILTVFSSSRESNSKTTPGASEEYCVSFNVRFTEDTSGLF